MAELEIDKEDVQDRSKWRRNGNVMKRKSNHNGPIIYIYFFKLILSNIGVEDME